MSQLIIILVVATAAGLTGTALGWFLRFITALGRKGSAELEIKEMIIEAREEAEKVLREAKDAAEKNLVESKSEIKEDEDRIQKIEDRLARREGLLDQRQVDLDDEEEELKKENRNLEKEKEQLQKISVLRKKQLEATTNLSEAEAREELLEILKNQYEEDLSVRTRKLEQQNKEVLERRAKNILATTIQRLANPVANDVFSTIIHLKNDEIKGKIIGKEGRNIKTFEKETGVELIIDDAPETLIFLLSILFGVR